MGKVACFKIIVALQIFERLIMNILSQADVLEPTDTMSHDDLNIGLTPFIICIEVMFISLGMLYFYWPGEFRAQRGQTTSESGDGAQHESDSRLSPVGAIIQVLNITDLLFGVARAIRLRIGKGRNKYNRITANEAKPEDESFHLANTEYRPGDQYEPPAY